MQAADFIRAHTRLSAPPLVPEIRLHLAAEPIWLWEETERRAGRTGLDAPFWAFPWAGGLALARYLLDHPERVTGCTVLDMASGSGLVAVAAAMAGAAEVTASDIDPTARAAITLNAAANDVRLCVSPGDLLKAAPDAAPSRPGPDLVLAGDAFYQRELATRMLAFLERAAASGSRVLVGDPGRTYLPRARFRAVAAYDVPVLAELEDAAVKRTTVWSLAEHGRH